MTPSAPLALDAYLKLPVAEYTWIIDGIVPTSGIVNLFAPSKLGKSMLVLDMARAISQGDTSWMGHTITNQAKVLFVQLDTPRSLWIERFQDLQKAGIDFTTNEVTEAMPNACEYFQMLDMESVPQPFNLMEAETRTWFNDHIEATKPDLVLIDTLREIHDMDEDKAGPMKIVLGQLLLAVTPKEGPRPAVLIITHSRKESPKFDGGLMQEGRGSNYLVGRCDTVMRMKGKENSDICQLMYKGRRTGHTVKTLNRNKETILWDLKDDPAANATAAWKADVAFVVRNPDNKKKTNADKARILQALHPDKKYGTCVSAINRYKG
jgi:RecA-family ATPase